VRLPLSHVHFLVSETLAAPHAAVFAIISDPAQRLEWQSSLKSVSVHTPGPARLGTRWREVTRVGVAFEMCISSFEAPTLWSERGHGWLADAQLQVEFHELPSATRVQVEVDIRFKAPFKLLAPLVQHFMPGALAADVQRVTALARALG
jgi:uncharacterized protein YndB with AHSA1/START domain